MNLYYLRNIGFTPKKILDIGCNVGQFYRLCQNVWGSVDCVLIDGNPNVKEDLDRLNVPYHITILSNEIKTVNWFSTVENPKCTGDSYYRENTKHYSDDKVIINVRDTNTLDNLFTDTQFDLIKIDTQGSEIDIIKGGINLCKKSKYIILETSLIEYNFDSPKEDEVTEFMKSIGFRMLNVLDVHYLVNVDTLERTMSQRDILYENENYEDSISQ